MQFISRKNTVPPLIRTGARNVETFCDSLLATPSSVRTPPTSRK